MNSNLFNMIGMGNIDIAYILLGMMVVIIILMVLVIVQISKSSKLKKRYEKFMQGKEVKSMEQEIIGLYEDNKFLKLSVEKNKKDVRTLYKKLESAYQKTGLVKYDAFKQMGGQLSFSLAILDENNNGFLLNSVHSAEGCYFYSKEIKNGESTLSLGEEEKQALELAMGEK